MVRVIATPMNTPLPKQGLFFKAGEAIRTPDIHVGNPQVSTPNMSLGVSMNDHSVQVLHLLRVDV